MIDDIEKKKKTSSREQLINSLALKMELSNTSDHKNLLSLKQEALDKNILFDPQNDSNLTMDVEDNLKLNQINKDFSRKAYMKELKEVIENSDVVLEVLDARDPMSCRSKELEAEIINHKDEKKIILILNKIDLIPM
jgi:nuclear GTP-binding protein